MIKKCDCGNKMYPHGCRLNQDNYLIEVFYCPNCGISVSEKTNKKVIVEKPVENPICTCKCPTQKWSKRYNKKNSTITYSYRCRVCKQFTNITVPCKIVKENNEKN